MTKTTWRRWGGAVGVALCMGFLLSGCRQTIAARPGHGPDAMTDAQATSRAAPFFGNATLSKPALSPDGTQIAAMMAQGGTEVLIVRPTLGGAIKPVAKLERTQSRVSYAVRRMGWASNERLLLSVERPHNASGVRARQTRLMSVAVEGGRPKYLGKDWPHESHTQSQDQIIDWLPNQPNFVLIGLWAPGQNGVGVRRLNVIHGGLSTLVRARYGTTGWSADHRGDVRAGWGEPRSGTEEFIYARESADHDWEEILRWDPFGGGDGFGFAGYSDDPTQIYVYRYTDDHNRLGVFRFDLAKRKLGSLVFAHPKYDVSGIRSANDDDRLLTVYYQGERPVAIPVDARSEAEHAAFDRALPNLLWRIIDADEAENHVIIETSSDVNPPRFFLYDRTAKKLVPLFSSHPGLEGMTFSKMEPIQYTARDGLEIPGYVTLPNSGEAPYPTIVYPHGGPWARDTWGWDPVVQYFASLGFAVFQPNFRGSTGYGEAFEIKGRGEWGLRMQDDITDGTRWLIDQKIADPERIGIYGASYGGYAALWGLVKTPDLFRAGASFAGVTDIPTLLSDDANYYSLVEEMEALVGDRSADRQRLIDTSPARNADEIQVPVFIAHGSEDWRVHVSQAEMMVDALEAAGVPVERHIYRGEVHGFIDERNRIDFYEKLGRFFERHLMADAGDVSAETR